MIRSRSNKKRKNTTASSTATTTTLNPPKEWLDEDTNNFIINFWFNKLNELISLSSAVASLVV